MADAALLARLRELMLTWSSPALSPALASATEAELARVCALRGACVCLCVIACSPATAPAHPQTPGEAAAVTRAMRGLAVTLLTNEIVAKHWNESAALDAVAAVRARIEHAAHAHALTHGQLHAYSQVDLDVASTVLASDEQAYLRSALPTLLGDVDTLVREGAVRLARRIALADMDADTGVAVDGDRAREAHNRTALAALEPYWRMLGGAASGDWVRVYASLQVLEALVPEVQPDVALELVRASLEFLLHVCAGTHMVAQAGSGGNTSRFALSVRTAAFTLLLSYTAALRTAVEYLGAPGKKAAKAILTPLMRMLLSACGEALSCACVCAHTTAMMNAAFRVVMDVMQSFPVLVKPFAPDMLSLLLGLIPRALDAFVRVDVDDGDHSTDALPASPLDVCADRDVETDVTGRPEILVVDILALLQICSLSKSAVWRGVFKSHGANVAQALVTASQLTEASLDRWEDDPYTFLDDTEDDDFDPAMSARKDIKLTCMGLLDCLSKNFAGLQLMSAALAAALAPSSAPGQRQGWLMLSRSRWKTVEAVVFLFGLCYKEFYAHQMEAARGVTVPPLAVDVNTFIAQLLGVLSSGGASVLSESERVRNAPYVLGRCMWSAAQVLKAASPEQRSGLVNAAADGLSEHMPVPLRIAACHALAKAVRKLDTPAVEALAPHLFARFLALLASRTTSEESLPSLVALITVTTLAAPLAAASVASAVCVPLLRAWLAFANSPYLQPAIGTALEALAQLPPPPGIESVVSYVAPVLRTIITHGAARSPLRTDTQVLDAHVLDVMMPSVLRLATVVIRRKAMEACQGSGAAASYAPVTQEAAALLPSVVSMITTCNDTLSLQHGCACIATSLRVHGAAALSSCCAPDALMSLLSRALAVETTDSAVRCMAPLVTAVVANVSDAVGGPLPVLATLLPAALQRLALSKTVSAHALLMIVAHVILCSPAKAMEVLASCHVTLPASGLFAANADSSDEKAISLAAAIAADHAAQTAPVLQHGVVVFLRGVARLHPLIADMVVSRAVAYAAMRLLAYPAVLQAGLAWSFPSHRVVLPPTSSRKTKTRSAVKAAGGVHPSIPLTVRVLTILVKWWADAVESGSVDDAASQATTPEEGAESDDGSDEDADAASDDNAGEAPAAVSSNARSRRRGKRNMYMDADFAHRMLGGDGAGDDEMMLLSDLLAGGDAMGAGSTLLSALGKGLSGRGLDTDSDDGDGDDEDGHGQADDDALLWDEAPDEPLLRHDPVVAQLRGSAIATDGAPLFASIVRLSLAGDAAASSLLSAVLTELDDDEKLLLNQRVLPLAASASP